MSRTADLDAPLDPREELGSMDDEFNKLTYDIDVCTERFMQIQTNMTTALHRYQWCGCVGMEAHMLGRLVHASIDIGLTMPQVEFLQQRLPDLQLMENDMWESTEEMEPHLDDLLRPRSSAKENHVYDNTEENLAITPLLEECTLDQPSHEERGPVALPMVGLEIVDKFIYLANEVADITHKFMRLQTTMTTALERYKKLILLCDRIAYTERVVLAAQHIGFDSQQRLYVERKIPDLLLMAEVSWAQCLEIKPHIPNILQSMDNQLKYLD